MSRSARLSSLLLALLAAGIVLLGFVLRVYRLGSQNVWWDEALAIWAVHKSLIGTTLWTAGDVHPPLYFWLLWPWVRLAGVSEFAGRYLTAVLGALAVAVATALGRRVGRQGGVPSERWPAATALLAGLLVATAHFEVWWSQEMRMYALAGLLALISVYLTLRLFGDLTSSPRSGETRDYGQSSSRARQSPFFLAYAVVNAAGLYTIYLFGLVILAEGVWVAWFAARRGALRWLVAWGLSGAVTLALLVPWLALALPRMHSWSVVSEPVSLGFVGQLYATLVALGISTDIDRYILPAAAFVALSLSGFVAARWRAGTVERSEVPTGDSASVLLALFLVLPPLIVWLLTQPRSLFYTPRVEARYLLPFAGPVYVLLAWSLVELSRRWRLPGMVLTVGVLAAIGWSLPQHYAGRVLQDELQSMVRVIGAYARPGDAVALVSGNRFPIFLYYYDQLPGSRPEVVQLPYQPRFTSTNVEGQLAPLVKAHTRLWLAEVDANLQDSRGLARRWLDEHRPKILSLGFGHNALHLYASPAEVTIPAPLVGNGEGGSGPSTEPAVPPENLGPQMPLRASIGPGIELLGYDLPVHELRPGHTAYLGLYLSSRQAGPVLVSWVDAAGRPFEDRRLDLPATGDAIIRRQLAFEVVDQMPLGVTRFRIEPADANGSSVLTNPVLLGGTHPATMDEVPHLTHAAVGTGIELTGFRLAADNGCSFEDTAPRDVGGGSGHGQPLGRLRFPTTAPGCTLDVTLYWRASAKPAEPYTVFVHLLGPGLNPATGGPVWAGHDGEPAEGRQPTTLWPADGLVVADRHPLVLDPAAPGGDYQIEVGMYRQPSLERLPVSGTGADAQARRIVLGPVEVAR